jgi:hypothetical protein
VEQPDGRAGRAFTFGLDDARTSQTELGLRPDGQSAAEIASPDHPSVRAMLRALMAAGPGAQERGWRHGEREAYVVARAGLEAVRIGLRGDSAEMAWDEVCRVTPLALDVLTVLLGRFASGAYAPFLLCAAEILEAKGCRRWGGERCALEEQIAGELVRLGRLCLGAAHEPVFDVAPVGDRMTSFFVTLNPTLCELWRAAPVRRLNGQILQFDHRLNRGPDVLAKKLGLNFSLAGAEGRPFVRRVRAVLKGVGVAPDPACGAGRRGRIADRFEEAVLRLQECGLFTVKYRRADDRLALDDRVKGWVGRWLGMELVIEPRPLPAPPHPAVRVGSQGAEGQLARAEASLA